jgi:hypothetical protein
LASVCALKGAVDTVTAWYKNGGTTTGVLDKLQRAPFFSLYPNPAKHAVTVEGDNIQQATVSVMEITGKVITKQHAQQGPIQILIDDLPAGIYWIQVTTADGTSTKPLIVD